MSVARPVSQWLTIYTTQTDGTPASISARILKDVFGYNSHTKSDRWREADEETLANALIAYRDFTNTLAATHAQVIATRGPVSLFEPFRDKSEIRKTTII